MNFDTTTTNILLIVILLILAYLLGTYRRTKHKIIVKNMMLKNKWINHMHTTVPGPDGKLSYGGYCFPKDTNALLQFMKKMNSPHKVLEAIIDERNEMRTDQKNIQTSKKYGFFENNSR